MIDAKPWPDARDLWALLHNPLPDGRRLARAWSRDGDTPVWLSRSAWGMAALGAAMAARLGREVRVWLPDYFCGEALLPLRAQRATITFYPVDSRGRPDWAWLRAQPTAPDILFLVHFFGHASDGAEARRFCDAAGGLLVEDATHAIGPSNGIGVDGDVVFYSPWKFFQTPNGALMLLRPRAEAWAEPVGRALAGFGRAVSPGLQWLKQAVRTRAAGASRQGGFPASSPEDYFVDVEFESMPLRPRPSPVTGPWLAGVDLAAAAARRRANDAALRDYLADLPGCAPFDAEPAHGPLRSAFRLASPEQASAAYARLRAAGIEAQPWPGLPPEVTDPKSIAVQLRRTVLNLPCHQGLTPDELIAALERSGLKARSPAAA
ncbi:hypothetical protein [Phenylobacterium sp.]|jgi:hypothetical protein|uniref:hypothetical protein n=1 Tax=Phenylobacterium sp. TaxID=1871053 RepID=UPI002F40536D